MARRKYGEPVGLVLAFAGPVFEWRGPAPYHFVAVPPEECEEIGEVAPEVTYGWGMIPARITLGISAAGVWNTTDGGATWQRGNTGLVAGYMPEDAREGTNDLCIHHLERAPGRPERLFMQFHGGVYRSDDAGESWTGIAEGLPSDFGFPLVVDPADPTVVSLQARRRASRPE